MKITNEGLLNENLKLISVEYFQFKVNNLFN